MDAPAHTLSSALEDAHHALQVRQFRLALLWPLRLMPSAAGDAVQRRAWQELRALGDASAWREVVDEYTGDREGFHERHYNEFVTFLPQVQHFLYGEGRARRGAGDRGAESPMRVFRRHDVAAVRPGYPTIRSAASRSSPTRAIARHRLASFVAASTS